MTERIGGADATAAVKRACIALLLEAGLERPPYKLSTLAKFLGAKIVYDNDSIVGDEEASLRIVDNQIVLWVSRQKFEDYRTRTRARFSIAHEIGHLILFKMLGPEFLEHSETNDKTYHKVERLCDLAASHILMPRDRLFEAISAYGFTSDAVRQLTKLFGVSPTALFKAVADVSPGGGVIELRTFSRKPIEPQAWRVWNAFTSSEDEQFSTWLPKGCTLKHIEGIPSPGTLGFEAPYAYSNVTLVRGKTRAIRDAVIVRWPIHDAGQIELLSSREVLSSKIRQDATQGRVIIIAAEPGRLAFTQFGAVSQQ